MTYVFCWEIENADRMNLKILKKYLPQKILQVKRVISQAPRMRIIRHERIIFLCPNRVMEQLALDIIAGFRSKDIAHRSRRLIVYVGIHCNFGRYWFRRGHKIGIQTEQIYDENQKPLWGRDKFDLKVNIEQALLFSDSILDLNSGNKYFYELEGLLKARRVRYLFGPYIFPSEPFDFKAKTGCSPLSLLFFGSIGDRGTRRRDVLEELSSKSQDLYNIVIPTDPVFYDDLACEMEVHDAVLNIHFDNGVYAEAPRLLSAYINGKPVVSEPLGSVFERSACYLAITRRDLTDLDLHYRNFSEVVVPQYSFLNALQKLEA